jgi:hypothetical protein
MANTISVTAVDTFRATYTLKKAGQKVLTGTRVIYRDGGTMTIPIKFTTAHGQQVDHLMVFDDK